MSDAAEPFARQQDEPLFVTVPQDDPALVAAVQRARSTCDRFRSLIAARTGPSVFHSAKLRFRDPEMSAELGEDRHINLWVSSVTWDGSSFVGRPFELPKSISWIRLDEDVRFQDHEVMDWMVNDDGHVFGAFSIRVIRQVLPEGRRPLYDEYIGAKSYEPEDA